MIGSPASRGAVASEEGADTLALTSAVSAVSAAIAAIVTMAGSLKRRIVDCVIENRSVAPMPPRLMPVRACLNQVSNRAIWIGWPDWAANVLLGTLGSSPRPGSLLSLSGVVLQSTD